MSRQSKRTPKTVLGLIFVVFYAAACQPQQTGEDPGRAAALDNVDAMSREHAGDSATPSEAASIPAERAVVAETLAYAEVNDELRYGHFVIPADMVDPLPALIVIHEWWGLNDNIRAMANRFAAEGYMVLAIDLYGGEAATTPAAARREMLKVVENPGLARENIRQALEFLKIAEAPSIASLGWCFGGGWSLNAAMLFPEDIDASVIYYGQVTDDAEKLHAIDGPILGLFAGDDRGIDVESVRAFKAAMDRLRKHNEIHIYPGVGHAFANPTGDNYNERAAENAWQRTVKFLAENLQASDET